MKKIIIPILAIVLIAIASCSKKGGTPAPSPTPTPTVVPEVRVSKATISANGFDESEITVVNKATGADITNQCAIFIAGSQTFSLKYATTDVGIVSVKAKLGTSESVSVIITATAPGASRHAQKVIAEDYTGTWCQFCPRIAKSLADISAANPNVLTVAIHNAGGDPFTYPFASQMMSKWGVTGYPTAIVNRNFTWSENPTEITNKLTGWAPLGLSIESAINGTTITGKVKTQFNVTSSIQFNITIMLLENGLIYPQVNAYNNTVGSPFFGLGNPIPNYVHDHTLRVASTSIFGDAIPATAVVKDNINETPFTFNASPYNINNCEIVAVVSYADNTPNRKGLANAQKVKAGQNKAFD
jgi:thiol-disulfide isomerase/thioredoxin